MVGAEQMGGSATGPAGEAVTPPPGIEQRSASSGALNLANSDMSGRKTMSNSFAPGIGQPLSASLRQGSLPHCPSFSTGGSLGVAGSSPSRKLSTLSSASSITAPPAIAATIEEIRARLRAQGGPVSRLPTVASIRDSRVTALPSTPGSDSKRSISSVSLPVRTDNTPMSAPTHSTVQRPQSAAGTHLPPLPPSSSTSQPNRSPPSSWFSSSELGLNRNSSSGADKTRSSPQPPLKSYRMSAPSSSTPTAVSTPKISQKGNHVGPQSEESAGRAPSAASASSSTAGASTVGADAISGSPSHWRSTSVEHVRRRSTEMGMVGERVAADGNVTERGSPGSSIEGSAVAKPSTEEMRNEERLAYSVARSGCPPVSSETENRSGHAAGSQTETSSRTDGALSSARSTTTSESHFPLSVPLASARSPIASVGNSAASEASQGARAVTSQRSNLHTTVLTPKNNGASSPTNAEAELISTCHELLNYVEALDQHRRSALKEAERLRQFNMDLSNMLQQANGREQQSHLELVKQRAALTLFQEKFTQLRAKTEGTVGQVIEQRDLLKEKLEEADRTLEQYVRDVDRLRQERAQQDATIEEGRKVRELLASCEQEKKAFQNQLEVLTLEQSRLLNSRNALQSEKTQLLNRVDELESENRARGDWWLNLLKAKGDLPSGSNKDDSVQEVVVPTEEYLEDLSRTFSQPHVTPDERLDLYRLVLGKWREAVEGMVEYRGYTVSLMSALDSYGLARPAPGGEYSDVEEPE